MCTYVLVVISSVKSEYLNTQLHQLHFLAHSAVFYSVASLVHFLWDSFSDTDTDFLTKTIADSVFVQVNYFYYLIVISFQKAGGIPGQTGYLFGCSGLTIWPALIQNPSSRVTVPAS